jgi:hypothetical protein
MQEPTILNYAHLSSQRRWGAHWSNEEVHDKAFLKGRPRKYMVFLLYLLRDAATLEAPAVCRDERLEEISRWPRRLSGDLYARSWSTRQKLYSNTCIYLFTTLIVAHCQSFTSSVSFHLLLTGVKKKL